MMNSLGTQHTITHNKRMKQSTQSRTRNAHSTLQTLLIPHTKEQRTTRVFQHTYIDSTQRASPIRTQHATRAHTQQTLRNTAHKSRKRTTAQTRLAQETNTSPTNNK
jgi:hypothetical protein